MSCGPHTHGIWALAVAAAIGLASPLACGQRGSEREAAGLAAPPAVQWKGFTPLSMARVPAPALRNAHFARDAKGFVIQIGTT